MSTFDQGNCCCDDSIRRDFIAWRCWVHGDVHRNIPEKLPLKPTHIRFTGHLCGPEDDNAMPIHTHKECCCAPNSIYWRCPVHGDIDFRTGPRDSQHKQDIEKLTRFLVKYLKDEVPSSGQVTDECAVDWAICLLGRWLRGRAAVKNVDKTT